MGLEIYLREDIKNGILAVQESSQRTAAMCQYTDKELAAYCRGVQDSLVAVALVFGVGDLPFDALPAPDSHAPGRASALSGSNKDRKM